MSLDGPRVAVVTGASSGIGLATVERLRKDGVVAIGLARRMDDTETSRRCDVRDESAVARVFAEIVARWGRIDILVNCAGIVSTTDPLSIATEEWDDVLRTNVLGTYRCCVHAIADMRRRRHGRIVNIGSVAGRSYSRTASPAYTSSKYAVIGLTRQLAAHVARDGITVNCVCPSQTRTEMLVANVPAERLETLGAAMPMGRLAEPEEVVDAICFLAGDGASYVNGAVVDVNGGLL